MMLGTREKSKVRGERKGAETEAKFSDREGEL
jgi:hypothetical protein